MTTATATDIHSLWTKLAKYKPEDVSDMVDRLFSKYNQPFRLLSVDDATRTVSIELKDGRKLEMKL